ncbi:hypothetical protein [Maribacter litopenaei]|uniref:hypothetical protein n=1 Tax=Maribacter litopenaei TaxID=2976127 RepID=UPI0030845C74
MKFYLNFLLVFVLISCGSKKITNETVLNPDDPDGLKGRMVSDNIKEDTKIEDNDNSSDILFSTADNMASLMEYLASDELEGRGSGSEGISKAAEFIEGILKNNGIDPYFESYRDTRKIMRALPIT